MQHFSKEYLENLINEHKLIQACINRLVNRKRLYLRENSAPILEATLSNLLITKLELEIKIDELREFLD